MFQPYNVQRAGRTEQFKIVPASVPTGTAAQTATGCTEGTFRCTVLRNGTGDVTLTYNNPFSRVPIAVVTPLHATLKLYVSKVSETASAVRFVCYDEGGTARDATGVDLIVQGFDSVDQTG